MKIAVLSGKGGTGKTLVSVNLAAVAKAASYLDCDVEEPNGHLFFKPTDVEETEVNVKIALVDQELCNGCRKCVEFCKFNALAYVKDRLIIFEDVCHSCGGCMLVCPQQALTEKNKPIGKIQSGRSDRVQVNSGILNTGEATGIPLINKLLEDNKENAADLTLIDCPPGSACIVMKSIKDGLLYFGCRTDLVWCTQFQYGIRTGQLIDKPLRCSYKCKQMIIRPRLSVKKIILKFWREYLLIVNSARLIQTAKLPVENGKSIALYSLICWKL